jgi:hypothetical protein
MGPHSYTKFDKGVIEQQDQNLAIIQKYAGAHGTASRTITL